MRLCSHRPLMFLYYYRPVRYYDPLVSTFNIPSCQSLAKMCISSTSCCRGGLADTQSAAGPEASLDHLHHLSEGVGDVGEAPLRITVPIGAIQVLVTGIQISATKVMTRMLLRHTGLVEDTGGIALPMGTLAAQNRPGHHRSYAREPHHDIHRRSSLTVCNPNKTAAN